MRFILPSILLWHGLVAATTCVPLNADGGAPLPDPARALAERALRVKAAFVANRAIDYAALAASPEFKEYAAAARALVPFDPATLRTTRAKTAFWINAYNALAVHAVVALRVEGSVGAAPDFFARAAYRVGRSCLSLDDIEHGILRANRPHGSAGRRFAQKDPRRALALSRLDPRVHFALHCASRGCPAIGFYDAATLDADLDHATRGYLASDARVRDGKIELPKILEWYRADFGPDLGAFVRRYANPELQKALDAKMPIAFAPYDWSLNQK